MAAGHTCLDLIPAFTIDGKVDKMTDVLVPGKMINMGKCVVVGGGPVTNAGVSIRRLGVKTELIGKIGDDDFGKQILNWYEEHEGHFKGIKMVEGRIDILHHRDLHPRHRPVLPASLRGKRHVRL